MKYINKYCLGTLVFSFYIIPHPYPTTISSKTGRKENYFWMMMLPGIVH